MLYSNARLWRVLFHLELFSLNHRSLISFNNEFSLAKDHEGRILSSLGLLPPPAPQGDRNRRQRKRFYL